MTLGDALNFVVSLTEENHICDKCGKKVPFKNSSRNVEMLVRNKTLGVVRDRHLFPTEDCPGSPSRAKLVRENSAWSKAYAELQQMDQAPTL